MTTEPVDPAIPEAVRPQPVKRSPAGSRLLNVALGVALVVATAGVAFAVGRATAPASAATGLPNFGGRNFPGGGNFPGASNNPNGGGSGGLGGLGGGLTIEGTVESISGDAVTIRTVSGTTITVGLSSDTEYHQAAEGAASDVQPGATVVVRVDGGFRGAGGGPGASGAPSLGTASDVTVEP